MENRWIMGWKSESNSSNFIKARDVEVGFYNNIKRSTERGKQMTPEERMFPF